MAQSERVEDLGPIEERVQEQASRSKTTDQAAGDMLERIAEDPDWEVYQEGEQEYDDATVPDSLKDAAEKLFNAERDGEPGDEDAGPEDEEGIGLEDALQEDEAEGDEEDYRTLDLDDEVLDSYVTIKVQGEEIDVPLREALNGYQRQSDYSRKTSEVAQLRKEATAAREQYGQALEAVATVLNDKLSTEDRQAVAQAWEGVQAEREIDAQRQLREVLQAEDARLTEAMGWDSREVAKEHKGQLRSYAHDLGFTDNDLRGVTDHRIMVVLDKARQFDELTSQGEEIRRGGRKSASPTLRPGTKAPGGSKASGKRKALTEAKKRARYSGSIHDSAEAISHLLDD